MSQEIEIEVKTLINEQEFQTLLDAFNFRLEDAILQHNHYFETADFSLKNVRSALRIREKNNTFTLTLKQPYETGLLETHQPLSIQETKLALDKGMLPSGEVLNQLLSLHIPINQLTHLGTLSTSRIEFPYNGGSLCLDKSSYFDIVDYELEFEGTSIDHAKATLKALLAEHGISKKPTPNKIRRFFTRKLELSS